MAAEHLHGVLLLTLLFGTAICTIPSASKAEVDHRDIRMFLGTNESIWTYNSTIHANITCKVDTMVNMTDELINYNRTFYFHGNKSGYPVEGTFFPYNDEHPNSILFGAPGGLKEGYELILFASENYTCAVINVTLTMGFPTFWYDLRVRNSSVDVGPTKDCANYFKTVAPKSDQLYTPICQGILPHTNVSYVKLRDIFN